MQQWIRNLFCLRQREREGLSYDAKRYVHTHLIRPHQSVATKLGRAIGESKIPLPVRNGQACRHSRGLVEGTKNKIMIQTNFLSVILRKMEKASSLCALRNGLGHVLGSFVSVLELACARHHLLLWRLHHRANHVLQSSQHRSFSTSASRCHKDDLKYEPLFQLFSSFSHYNINYSFNNT